MPLDITTPRISPAAAPPAPRVPAPAARVFALPPLVLLAGFVMAAVGGCLDYQFPFPFFETQHYHALFCGGLVALLLVFDREPVPFRRRLWIVIGSLALLVVCAEAMRRGVFGLPERRALTYDRMMRWMFHSPAPWAWAAGLWLGAPLLLSWRHSPALSAAVGALLLYGNLCLASAAVSQIPETSLGLFYRERALPFALLLAWMRVAGADPALRAATARAVVWSLAVAVLLGALVGWGDLTGSAPLRKELVTRGLVYQEVERQTEATVPERRVIYPMLHFNRTAYLALLATMALLTASCGTRRRGIERWSPAAIAPALLVLVLSYTRGITVATIGGLCAWAALVSRRALALIVLACVMAVLALPAARREHYLSIFKPSTYRPDEGPMTSMKLRLLGWRYGLETVRRLPLTGVGYGTRAVREDYERHIRSAGDPRLVKYVNDEAVHVHMHNMPLEIAVESGLPALAAFLAFTLIRWWVLGRAWLRAAGSGRRRVAAWIAFEIAIMIAGMLFYMLKQNFGMINFFVWGAMLVEFEDKS